MRDRLEEYVDGLLDAEETRAMEAALEKDRALREELAEVRRFAGALESLDPGLLEVEQAVARARARERRFTILRRLVVAGAVAASLFFAAVALDRDEPPQEPAWVGRVQQQALGFGHRLGAIAKERREGRIPRIGVGGLEVPPAAAYGIVFTGALEELGVEIPDDKRAPVADLVMKHHLRAREHRGSLQGERERADASLALYDRLEDLAGVEVADAYYDVFRPGLTDFDTTLRVAPGNLRFVVENERYLGAYERVIEDLTARYGRSNVALVLEHLAPKDHRTRWYDASQDGVGRNVVLAIRARLYQAACDAGVDRLYVEQ